MNRIFKKFQSSSTRQHYNKPLSQFKIQTIRKGYTISTILFIFGVAFGGAMYQHEFFLMQQRQDEEFLVKLNYIRKVIRDL